MCKDRVGGDWQLYVFAQLKRVASRLQRATVNEDLCARGNVGFFQGGTQHVQFCLRSFTLPLPSEIQTVIVTVFCKSRMLTGIFGGEQQILRHPL